MSEVERYWIDPSRLIQEGWHQDDTCVVKDWAYDRVVAERDALQQRLTAADERADHNARVSAIAAEDVLLLQKRVDVLEGLLRLLAELPGVRTSGMWDRVVDALKPAEAAHDFSMIGTEKMHPMEYDEP